LAPSGLPVFSPAWVYRRTRRQVRAVLMEDVGERVRRARAYIAKVEGAVSGQGGHNRTFRVANLLRQRFGLSYEEAFPDDLTQAMRAVFERMHRAGFPRRVVRRGLRRVLLPVPAVRAGGERPRGVPPVVRRREVAGAVSGWPATSRRPASRVYRIDHLLKTELAWRPGRWSAASATCTAPSRSVAGGLVRSTWLLVSHPLGDRAVKERHHLVELLGDEHPQCLGQVGIGPIPGVVDKCGPTAPRLMGTLLRSNRRYIRSTKSRSIRDSGR